jgi:hypothetical protein
VSGTVCYHLAAKSIPKTLDAALVLVVAYTTALVASIAAYFLLPGTATSAEPVRLWHPAAMVVGLAAFLIEFGYVLMYWTAWPISMASVVTNGLGVRPSKCRDGHITSCCALTLSVVTVADGRVGVPFRIEAVGRIVLLFIHRGGGA